MIENHLEDIFDHFESEYPREGCGVIGISKGKTRWFPCANVAENDLEFVLDTNDYINASLKSDLVAVVHSHPDMSEKPSAADILQCNHSKLDYYILSWPKVEIYHLKPEKKINPLIGREFKWGYNDCWSLFKDYYEQELSIELKSDIPEIVMRRNIDIDEWWDRGINYFVEQSKDYGFEEVTDGSLLKNDALLFAIFSEIPNHCGIYLGDNLILHHSHNRISCRENLYPFWAKTKTHVMRYTCKM